MSSLEWLKKAGKQYLERIRIEDPVFIVELDIGPKETAELLGHLGRCRALPWESWAHACVAVAAVQVAHEAPGDERSFPHLFMDRLRLPYSQKVWEEDYGKRIEECLQSHFPDDFRSYGPFRYVGPVYRHAGIPAIALPRFAHFLRRLLTDYGPAFTRPEYDLARRRVLGVASRFLRSDYGFQYAHNASRVLYHIDIGLIAQTELASISGYRTDFWTEVIAIAGVGEPDVRPSKHKPYAEPILALSIQDARLVLRFDPRAVKNAAAHVDGRAVLYSEVPVTSVDAPHIEIGGHVHRLNGWWSPGDTPAALFRSSDGRFVASGGGVPAGDYYLVAEQTFVPGNELSADEINYVSDSDYRIWRITITPGLCLPGCNLYGTGSKPIPQIEFASSGTHVFGPNIFEEQLPDLLLRNWNNENAHRFWIFIDDGSGPRQLKVSPGQDRVKLSTSCPATGAVWVESRGFYRQTSALPHLAYTILPKGFKLEFPQKCFWIDDPAFARIIVPTGWRVHLLTSCSQTESGMWRIPGKERVLIGTLNSNDLRVPFSARVPRASMNMHPRDRIWWKETDIPERTAHIEGVPGLSCSLYLLGDRGPFEILSPIRIGRNGTAQLRALEFRDALALSGVLAGEFGLSVSGGEPLRTGWHFASAPRILEKIKVLPNSSAVFKLPTIGSTLRAAHDLYECSVGSLDCGFIREKTPVSYWLSNIALCAYIFDGTQLSADVSMYAEEAIRTICDWYKLALSCTSLGAQSADALRACPRDSETLPIPRWRHKIQQQIHRLELQSDVSGLISDWRNAVKRRDGSAMETQLAKRPGGEQLTEGARKYLIGMQTSGRTKNQALNGAIGCLQRSRESTNCPVVRAVAAGLLELAYNHSNRNVSIADVLRKEYEAAGISSASFSPWEGDIGNNISRTRTVEANS